MGLFAENGLNFFLATPFQIFGAILAL